MRDLQFLDKTLLNAEFELAREIYEQARREGFGPVKAAALVYRHGHLDGCAKMKDRANDAHRRLHEYISKNPERSDEQPSPPEATIEGGTTNE